MGRKLRSPTRTISNRGELPRFIGQFPCTKGATFPLTFDSLSALLCGVYLEWRPDVVSVAFEPREYEFEETSDLPELTCVPDYEAILDTGELELYEAKYAENDLRDTERTKLELTAAHCRQQGIPYHVIYRDILEKDGFIGTVMLLRPYGQLKFSAETVVGAEKRLSGFDEAELETWRERAQDAGVPTGLLYHLLYHQRLPLVYQPLIQVELLPCRA